VIWSVQAKRGLSGSDRWCRGEQVRSTACCGRCSARCRGRRRGDQLPGDGLVLELRNEYDDQVTIHQDADAT